MEALFIDNHDCRETITVGDLIEILSELDEGTPIYILDKGRLVSVGADNLELGITEEYE